MVLLYHISLTPAVFSTLPGNPAMPFYLGVELFFVISGFVVTRSLFGRNPSAVAFLLRRIFRMTPAILVFLMFSLVVFTLIAAQPSQESVQALNMGGAGRFVRQSTAIVTGTLINRSDPPLYFFGAMWSLSVEYQFYSVYALLAGLLFVVGVNVNIAKSVLFVGGSGLLGTLLIIRTSIIDYPRSCDMQMCSLISYILLWRFDFLLCGAVLAFATDRWGQIPLPSRRVVLAISGIALAVTCAVGMWAEPEMSAVKPRYEQVLMPLSAAAFTLIVAMCSGVPKRPTSESRTQNVMIWLGDRSFSMYLFHFPVMALIWSAITNYAPSLFYQGPFVYGAVQSVPTFALTIVLADIVYRYVELPCNAFGERVSRHAELMIQKMLHTSSAAI